MPGLLRGMARTAVIAGTATAVSNNVSRRQYQRWSAKDEAESDQTAPEPAPPAAAETDPYTQLENLGHLKDQGYITQDEFDAKKRQLLGL